jgi:arsenate reductase
MIKVLFVCIHNSARSQMAEAFFNHYATDSLAQSAGITPGSINAYVVEAMKEKGFDLSTNVAKSVFDLYKEGQTYSHIIAVCDEASQKCPIFPGFHKRMAWSFPDPSQLQGTKEEIMQEIRTIRDSIETQVQELLMSIGESQP